MAIPFASIRAICVLPHQLDSKHSTRCALVKTKNRSHLRHRGFNASHGTLPAAVESADEEMRHDASPRVRTRTRQGRSHPQIATVHCLDSWTPDGEDVFKFKRGTFIEPCQLSTADLVAIHETHCGNHRRL